MHIEIQVALNFVISYLYNKLPRRRVNIFGEELEKALKDKFQGHWYPEKPYKGSAFRCLKTGDPIDAVLERAARESGVPITDILENLPNELSVWVDPGEVSYRIGEKNVVKILYSENSDNHDENNSADREVNKTFNPEAQCFRPIDTVHTGMHNLSLSPKTSPLSGSSPHSASSTSPTYKSSPNPITVNGNGITSFMQRAQAPLTFTTATFAQTKFGSTKLKTSSKRSNSSYRMSPTEFSNYIKQRAIQQQQQQLHHHAHNTNSQNSNHFGPIGPVSPARSLSPNPMGLGLGQNSNGGGSAGANSDPFYFPNINMNGSMGYHQYNGQRNIFDTQYQDASNTNNTTGGGGIYGGGHNKFNSYLDPHGFYGMRNIMQQQQQQQQQHNINLKLNAAINRSLTITDCKDLNEITNNTNTTNTTNNTNNNNTNNNNNNNNTNTNNKINAITVTLSSDSSQQKITSSPIPPPSPTASPIQDSTNTTPSKLLVDGLNSFYTNASGNYQQLLVAN